MSSLRMAIALTGLSLAALSLGASGCKSAGYSDAYYAQASFPHEGARVSVADFHDALAPYGRWVDVDPYGSCWVPEDVGYGWRPYTDGYWGYSDYGWTWVSYEPWGWAPYHYGRWAYDSFYGWVWVPDTVWGPAWVTWRYGDDWLGWAPLAPGVSWSGYGLASFDVYNIPASRWCFTERRYFLDRNLVSHLVPIARNQGVFTTTTPVLGFGRRNGHPVNRGLSLSVVERFANRSPAYLKPDNSRAWPRETAAPSRGGQKNWLGSWLRLRSEKATGTGKAGNESITPRGVQGPNRSEQPAPGGRQRDVRERKQETKANAVERRIESRRQPERKSSLGFRNSAPAPTPALSSPQRRMEAPRLERRIQRSAPDPAQGHAERAAPRSQSPEHSQSRGKKGSGR